MWNSRFYFKYCGIIFIHVGSKFMDYQIFAGMLGRNFVGNGFVAL